MKSSTPILNTTRLLLAAAVLSTVVTGCGRRNADAPTAGASSADSSTAASTGMNKDASTAAAGTAGSSGAAGTASNMGTGPGAAAPGNNVSDSTSATSPAATGTGMTADAAGAASSGASTSGTSAAGSGASAATPNDAQIAAIVMTVNTSEIDAGKLAESKGQNAKVKDYAREMIKEHTVMNQEGSALTKKKHLSPQESDVTKTMKDDAGKVAANLKSATGHSFDKAYIDSQVADHEKVLMMIDNVLLPNAKDAELKAMLQKARPAVNMHLDQAKALQTSMK